MCLNTNAAAAVALLPPRLPLAYVVKADLNHVAERRYRWPGGITAEPSTTNGSAGNPLGALGGYSSRVLPLSVWTKLRMIDPVGLIQHTGVCGLAGLLLVPITNSGASFSGQLIARKPTIFGWDSWQAWFTWGMHKAVMGLRGQRRGRIRGVRYFELRRKPIRSSLAQN